MLMLLDAARRALPCALMLCLAIPANAKDPNKYDPLLDVAPSAARNPDNQYVPPDPRAPGFMIGALLGTYLGAIKSRLTEQLSTLDRGARPFIGLGFGGRTRSPIELGIDIGLGLGRTWSPQFGVFLTAFDVFIQPRILVHFYESEYLGLYAGLGAETFLFDVEAEGLNQAGIGPSAIFGLLHRLDQHSLIFIEASATAYYNFLAYRFENPTAAELEENPLAEPSKVDGDWFGIMRLSIGYRLTAF